MISVTKSQKNALWITHSFLRQSRLIQRSRILRASGSRVLRVSSSKAVSPIAPHRHARDLAIGEGNHTDGRYGRRQPPLLRALRSPLGHPHLSSPPPALVWPLAIGTANAWGEKTRRLIRWRVCGERGASGKFPTAGRSLSVLSIDSKPCVTGECPTWGAGNAHGISAVAAARSCLRRVSPATSWPRGPMESCWRWTASSAPALSARSRQATRIVRPQPQRMVRSRRDRARHWRACSRSMMPLLPALCGARESPAAITRALALSCIACVPSTPLPKRNAIPMRP